MNAQSQKVIPFAEHITAALLFKRLMEFLPDHVYFKDREGRFIYINKSHAEFFGLNSPEQAIGKSDFDFFPPHLAKEKDADEREIIRTGVGMVCKEEQSDQPGRVFWALSTKLPLVGENGEIIGTFGISRDVTDNKQAREALVAHHRLLETLIEILPCRIFIKDAGGRIQLSNEAYREALGITNAEDLYGRRLDEIITDPTVTQMTSDDRRVLDGESILNREEFDASPLGRSRWNLLSKVPLLDLNGKVQGIVGMSADITPQKEAEDRALRSQHALELRTREMESELALAREMQTELMQASIQNVREAVDLTAPFAPHLVYVYQPCAHVAGDFFQAVPLSSGKFGMLVCDVMGHGVKAALVTTLIRGLLQEFVSRDLKPGHLLAALNERLCTMLDKPTMPRFVTALYATVDVTTGHLLVANAGHPWPLWMDDKASPVPISVDESGPALGLIPGASYFTEERLLSPGTRILLYTDGLTEEPNATGVEFGLERLCQSMSSSIDRTPEKALHSILSDVRAFSAQGANGDDLCAVMASF